LSGRRKEIFDLVMSLQGGLIHDPSH